MPSVIPAIVTAALSTATGVALGTIASAVAFKAFAAQVVLGLISTVLSPKPKKPDIGNFAQTASARTSTIRQPIVYRRMVLGEVRVSGPMVFFESDSNNKLHHMVIVLASHEVDSIGTIYVNDTPVYDAQLDGNGLVTSGKYANKLRFKKHLGGTGQVADTDLVSETTGWTSAHVGNKTAYLYVRLDYDRDTFPTGLPNFSAVVRGAKIYDTRTATTLYSVNASLHVRNYLTDTRFGKAVPTAELDDTLFTSAANTCDEFVTTESVTQTSTGTADTTNDTISLSGSIVKFQTGDRVQLTTDGTLPTGLSLSTNYFVIVHQEQSTDEGEVVKIKLASSYLNSIARTPIDITSVGSGTHTVTKNAEPRYTVNGTIDMDKKYGEAIEELLSASYGKAANIAGIWSVFAGAYVSPVLTLDETHIVGPIQVSPKVSRRDRFNTLKGIYVNPQNLYQPADYPEVTNSTYVTEDGETIVRQLDLPFTLRSQTAQRIAKIALELARQEITCKIPFNLHAFQAQTGDTINLTVTKNGWSSKVFEVLESSLSWQAPQGNAQGPPAPVVELSLKETTSSAYSFTSSTDETTVDPAPDTNLPSIFTVGAPSGLTFTEDVYDLYGVAVLSWTASVDQFVVGGGHYEIQYKLQSASTYNDEQARPSEPGFHIRDLSVGDYDFRVRAVSVFGKKSDYITVQGSISVAPVIGRVTHLELVE